MNWQHCLKVSSLLEDMLITLWEITSVRSTSVKALKDCKVFKQRYRSWQGNDNGEHIQHIWTPNYQRCSLCSRICHGLVSASPPFANSVIKGAPCVLEQPMNT